MAAWSRRAPRGHPSRWCGRRFAGWPATIARRRGRRVAPAPSDAGPRRGPGSTATAGSPGASRPIGSIPWAVAPVRVGDRVPAAVFVARGRPPGAIARELAPWLAAGLAVLLVAGTALAAVAIFRPAHARLRDLESAVRRFGDGDRTARASTRGGDEVSAVAAAFNRMADEAGARESALVEADRARRQLLADVSHELRTPLTSIRGYAETLTLPGFAPPTAPGQQAVHVVGVEAQRLERIVNDLLDLARLDAGGAPLEVAPVRGPRSVHAGRGAASDPTPTAAGIALAVRIDPGAEVVPGDEVRLEQVVQNLTANAVRHARRGGRVELVATARRRRRAVDGDATTAPASIRRTCRTSSIASTRPIRRGRAAPAPGWACRSSRRSSSVTAARCRRRARPACGRPSRSGCRRPVSWPWRRAAGAGSARSRRGRPACSRPLKMPCSRGMLSAISSNRSPRSMRSALPAAVTVPLRGHEPAAQRLVDARPRRRPRRGPPPRLRRRPPTWPVSTA